VSDLERIGDDLPDILKRIGLPEPDAASRVMEEWTDLAGDVWAARARPSGLRDGVLVVVAADGATATLLKYRSTELLGRLEERLGRGVVTAVRVTVSGRGNGP
jgi:predicted nucleic acid-binding Zn ribbon protein